MSWFEVDCFVCPARLETADIEELLRFASEHEKCGE